MKNTFLIGFCVITVFAMGASQLFSGARQEPATDRLDIEDTEKATSDSTAADQQSGQAESTFKLPEKVQIELARETVRMLDDIYKGGIVTITDRYVTEDSEIPAGTAFKQIFAIAKQKGWHEARLLDVTGEPYNDENVAVDDFEKRGVKKMVAGESYYEEIEEVDGKKFLRAITPIPVVFEKCTWCHSNYEDVEKGKAIGAMGYRIPLQRKPIVK